MSTPFDARTVAKLGWRQGAVLGPELARVARESAPGAMRVMESDWIIVTSHDCDVVNERLDKEPYVELLRATPTGASAADRSLAGGRNPRSMQLVVDTGDTKVVVACKVHDRWLLARDVLQREAPAFALPDRARRLISEWLAKRYIRSAFPSAFDDRWRSKMKDWTRLLEKRSAAIQGIYLRLDTLDELPTDRPYRCDFIVAAPAKARREAGWADTREAIAREIEAFWKQFAPGVVVDEVEVLGTDELTLADIERHQRFDADWVSFADDTDTTPSVVDMTT